MGKVLPEIQVPSGPITALAPMQDVTTLPFMEVIGAYGPPDYFFTEYFRVHGHSSLEEHILTSITHNKTGRPVFAQLIGESLPDMSRTVKELLKHPVAGIDLNMGCPAPKVYKKNVGGGLLRDLNKIDELLGYLRENIEGLFTVKMRIGFEGTEHFEGLLELINKHNIDLLNLHGRTVKEMYRGDVHYDFIKRAAEVVNCPVLANGNITSAKKALEVLEYTGVAGVMIGRSAIRNPWIFRQIKEAVLGEALFEPKLHDVFDYVERLYEALNFEGLDEKFQVNRMKKFLNFVGQGVDSEGAFLHAIRRVKTKVEFFDVCKSFLLENGNYDKLFAAEPYEGVVARPNCEGEATKDASCSLETITA